MSPPLGCLEDGPGKIHVPAASLETTAESCPGLTEHNYMVLSDSSTCDSSIVNSGLDEKDGSLNLKATELRLGLPGSQSPVRDLDFSLSSNPKIGEKNLFPMTPIKEETAEEKQLRSIIYPNLQKTVVSASGNKRVFSDAMDGFPEVKFIGDSRLTIPSVGMKEGCGTWHITGLEHSGVMIPTGPSTDLVGKNGPIKDHAGTNAVMMKEMVSSKVSQDRPCILNGSNSTSNHGVAPAAKVQVVGWPPVRSYHKNTLSATSKINEKVDGKPGSGTLFVKVSMDGVPYLRKVDLKTCATYNELSSSLEKMFGCYTIGQCGSHGALGRDVLSEGKLIDLIHGSEYVLTYEDKDGDWMLVGDVPWDMFVDSCRRLRIMKGSDAIGLAPRAMEKCRNRN